MGYSWRKSFILLLFVEQISAQYDVVSVIPGSRMSVNDDMFVSASNAFSNFAVIMYPFRQEVEGGPMRCNVRYNDTDRFVHGISVAGLSKNYNETNIFRFVFAAEKMSEKRPYICVVTILNFTCAFRQWCEFVRPADNRQEYFLIGVDSTGRFAYAFTSSFVIRVDVYMNQIIQSLSIEDLWPQQGFIPHSLDMANNWAVVAGYGYNDVVKKNYAAVACFVDLNNLSNSNCTILVAETTYLIPNDVIYYNELYELSVAIRNDKVLVGLHRLETVVILRRVNRSLSVTQTSRLSYPEALQFGRVIDWADDSTVAILVLNPTQTPWSKSQIFFFQESVINATMPLFVFPNNQQIVGSRLLRPTFARFAITADRNLAILTNSGDILIIPTSSIGYSSRWTEVMGRSFTFYYKPQLCIGGTYKNQTNLGPCQICPPGTRNPGTSNETVFQCTLCSTSSSNVMCPLAALAEVDRETIKSYSQATAYPESPDITDIEDILMKNMFQISGERRCLLISPLLWTLVVSGFCLLILFSMFIIKAFNCQKYDKYRKHLKAIFRHTDIIGEGEMWAGGLATLAIVVLVSFSYWFSASFLRRYPIEDITSPALFACDQNLTNAQFSSGLDLLDLPKSDEMRPIFDLLDRQEFYLAFEFINTGFSCDAVTTQENLLATKYVPLPTTCERSELIATTSVTVRLPRHITTVQVNLTGPFWIGAIRLCIRGDGSTNASRTLRELDFCQLYESPDEAIGRMTTIPIQFIRNINITQPLQPDESTRYSGLWMPTFTRVALSDEAYYVEFGNYLRYTSSLTIVQVSLDERPFYIKNMQQPIVRTAELIFHGLLFTSLCIELFAFTFLLIKLFIVPLLRSATCVWGRVRQRDDKSQASMTTTTTNSTSKYQMTADSPIWKIPTTNGVKQRIDLSRLDSMDDSDHKKDFNETEFTAHQTICRL